MNWAAKNGVGTIDTTKNRLVGMKSRGVYETPGGTILFAAHAGLEQLILDRDTTQYKGIVAQKFSELVYDGLWYTPMREAISAFVDVTQKEVTGTVKMKLYKGTAYVAARKSPYSLYSEEFATFSKDEVYNQQDAADSSTSSPCHSRSVLFRNRLLKEEQKNMKLWKGRFSKAATSSADEFNASIEFDQRLYKEDITGSIAHAKMLAKQGIIIRREDADLIIKTLKEILADIEAGKVEFTIESEDIHMNIESILTERIGDAGKLPLREAEMTDHDRHPAVSKKRNRRN